MEVNNRNYVISHINSSSASRKGHLPKKAFKGRRMQFQKANIFFNIEVLIIYLFLSTYGSTQAGSKGAKKAGFILLT